MTKDKPLRKIIEETSHLNKIGNDFLNYTINMSYKHKKSGCNFEM